MTTATRTVLVTALGPAIWGTTYYVTTEWLPSGYPVLDGAIRALPAGLVLLALRWQRPQGIWWLRLAVLGLLNVGLFFPLLFVAAQRLPGGVAGAVGAAQPLLVLLLSRVMLGARITAAEIGAGVVGVLGVSLLVLRASGGVDPIGLLAIATGTALMAFAVVLAKRWGPPPMPAVTLTGWMLLFGGAMLAPFALATEGLPSSLSLGNALGYVYLAAFGGALSYFAWMNGISRLPAPAVSFLTLVNPVVAATLGWVGLHQSLNALQLTGMAIAFGALIAGQRLTRPATRPTVAPARMVSCQPTLHSPQRAISRSRPPAVSPLD